MPADENFAGVEVATCEPSEWVIWKEEIGGIDPEVGQWERGWGSGRGMQC